MCTINDDCTSNSNSNVDAGLAVQCEDNESAAVTRRSVQRAVCLWELGPCLWEMNR